MGVYKKTNHWENRSAGFTQTCICAFSVSQGNHISIMKHEETEYYEPTQTFRYGLWVVFLVLILCPPPLMMDRYLEDNIVCLLFQFYPRLFSNLTHRWPLRGTAAPSDNCAWSPCLLCILTPTQRANIQILLSNCVTPSETGHWTRLCSAHSEFICTAAQAKKLIIKVSKMSPWSLFSNIFSSVFALGRSYWLS